jgi:hypothetical protein
MSALAGEPCPALPVKLHVTPLLAATALLVGLKMRPDA